MISQVLQYFTSWLKKIPERKSDPYTEREYRKLAEEALQKAVIILEGDGWKKEKTCEEDTIFSKTIPVYGKVFKYEGTLPVKPEKILDLLYFKGEDMHRWNPTVKRVKIIQKIDDNLDIAHVISSEGAAGLVASRDFVNVRIWKKKDSTYIHGSVSTTHPDFPSVTNYIRAEQGPSVYVFTPINGNEGQCKLKWLLNTDIKGWVPRYLIDQALSTMMLDYINSLRKYISSAKSNA